MWQAASRTVFVTIAVAALTTPASAQLQQPTGAKMDERPVRAAMDAYLAAGKRGDLESLKRMWTADGTYMDSRGQVFVAREALAQQAGLPQPAADPTGDSIPKSSLRFVTPDVVVEDGIIAGGEAEDGRKVAGRFTAIWVRRDGRWMLDSLREVVTSSAATNAQLQPLNWLLGEWTGATDDAEILVSSRWSEAGRYIVRDFAVRQDNGTTITGTQRIGWDPESNQIKCWTFDSQGGAGQGHWRRDGDRWLVESTDISADGKKSHTTATYIPASDGRFVWEVTSAWDNKESPAGAGTLPALRIEFQRAADE